MNDLDEIKEFKNWSIMDKFYFFDNNCIDILSKLEIKAVQQFLNEIILNPNENSNIRKMALENFMYLVKLQKIKKRIALNLLLDNWIETGDVFLETIRLKSLILFYDDGLEEKEEIEDLYYSLMEHEENEIKSESLFQIALIFFLKANVMKDKDTYLTCLKKSLEYFKGSNIHIENRIDAEFFIVTVTNLINIIQGRDRDFEQSIRKTAQLLWEQQLYSLDGTISSVQVGLYRTLYAFKSIKIVNPKDWLDYRKEFNDLCYYFYEIKNQKIKNDLLKNVSDNLIRRSVEPIFALNFNAEICRINKRINEVDNDSKEYEFLLYLKKIASESKLKENAETNLILNKFINTFPHIEKERIEQEIKKIDEVHDTQSILHLFEILSDSSYENLLDVVISACLNMQGNLIYRNASENERNTFIASLLEMAGFNNKDQTLWGKSRAGKTSGEIDIFVRKKNGDPFSIIEALNLSSLTKSYLEFHLDKIFGYDTTGLKYNFILVYSSSKNFNEFWDKYIKHIQIHSYPYPIVKFEEVDGYDFADIRVCKTAHIRKGKELYLYHIVMDLF